MTKYKNKCHPKRETKAAVLAAAFEDPPPTVLALAKRLKVSGTRIRQLAKILKVEFTPDKPKREPNV